MFFRYPKRKQPNKITFYRMKKNIIDHESFIKSRSKSNVNEHRETDEINIVASILVNPMNSYRKFENKKSVRKSRV